MKGGPGQMNYLDERFVGLAAVQNPEQCTT